MADEKAEERAAISIGVKGKKSGDVPSDWKDIVRGIVGVRITEERIQSLQVFATPMGLRELRKQLDGGIFHIGYTVKKPSNASLKAGVFSVKARREV